MRATKKAENGNNRITVNTCELQELLGCGRAGAVAVGEAAHARISIGRLVFWNVRKIQEYIDSISE